MNPEPEQPLLLDVPAALNAAVEELREHTGERWQERNPELAQLACELFRVYGNYSAVAQLIGPLCGKDGEGQIDGFRKILQPTINRMLGAVEVVNIIKTTALTGVMNGIAKTNELIAMAKSAKEVGGVAMAVQILHSIYQLQAGGATSISGKTGSAPAAKVDKFREAAQRKLDALKRNAVEVEMLPEPVAMPLGPLGQKEEVRIQEEE